MGSEGESSDFNLPIYVAVGRNVKEGKSLLTWAVENFDGRNICLVHVHQPANFVSLLNGKLSTSKLKNQVVKACQEFERSKMQKLMNQYLLFLSQMGKQADKVWIEMRNIEKGILQLITQHSIRRLIMGAGAETFKSKILSETNSTKAMVVCQQAPLSCHLWFVSQGRLIYARPVSFGSHLTTTVTLSPSTSSGGTILTRDPKENMDVGAENVQSFESPNRSIDDVVSTMNPSALTVRQTSGGGSPSPLKVERPEYLTCSSSNTSLDSEFQDEETCDLRNKLENAMIDTEKFKYTFEESLRWWRAEEDALEAMRKAEAAEGLGKEETNRCKEMEELLHRQKQEMETMKSQHDQILKELQLIQDQKPALESQLRQAYDSEKELEDKIIQAVNLLITFKGTRDRLQIEYDSAVRKVNKYRALQKEDPLGISSAHFFGISFSDIIEATQNFKPSQKIGEGRYGSVFKGVLCHVKVAIKMLPSLGSQSDSEFKNEVEFLSRVRHPNLVTLIGACPESRSLVYEYIENGSLEDYLSGRAKSGSLSWQSRIKIAIDICSAILFLHANNTCYVHGNLKPSDILLDANFVTKISDFGINNLISENENPSGFHTLGSKNDPEKLAYMDPESFENGKLTTESDVYSFGVVLLRLLTARPATSVIRDVNCAMERGNLDAVLDTSAGDWPLRQAKQLANLALRCCEKDPMDRPDLASEIWTVLEPMRELCTSSQLTSASSCMDSRSQHKIPSHFVCPIYQEVMKDPHIAGDGFTYEAEAIRGWFDSGHKTSPMTNLKLDNCDLLPNYALYYAIQEWQQNT
ncbi:U-box domain-containing protein 32 [Sesamum alatum]|uniref:RING-type E3 ubiquitin transferase n=1 Tax=Sesamum alatum TaxID=300844 RepID=A0AAE2CR64_9LAMI|nr:U-box domain-containing protein 32 [Sesamum alatum]